MFSFLQITILSYQAYVGEILYYLYYLIVLSLLFRTNTYNKREKNLVRWGLQIKSSSYWDLIISLHDTAV